jgi:hypothetical protein
MTSTSDDQPIQRFVFGTFGDFNHLPSFLELKMKAEDCPLVLLRPLLGQARAFHTVLTNYYGNRPLMSFVFGLCEFVTARNWTSA